MAETVAGGLQGHLAGLVKSHLRDVTVFNMRNLVAEGMGAGTAGGLSALAGVFETLESPNRAALTKIHQTIGAQMQTDVRRSYSQKPQRGLGAYRNDDKTVSASGKSNERYSGRLRAALADPALVTATSDGIDFLNKEILDSRAPHWYRMSFGTNALGAATRHPTYKLMLDGQSFGTVSLATLGKSRKVHIVPRGRFVAPGEFWRSGYTGPGGLDVESRIPLSLKTPQVSRGIRGKAFLDVGLASMARNIGPAYIAYMTSEIERASRSKGTKLGRSLLSRFKRVTVQAIGR